MKKDGTHIREEIKGGHEKNMFGILLTPPHIHSGVTSPGDFRAARQSDTPALKSRPSASPRKTCVTLS